MGLWAASEGRNGGTRARRPTDSRLLEMKKFGINQRRQQLRKNDWPNAEAWLGPEEKSGWFSASRTLPLILDLLDSKAVSGRASAVEDVSRIAITTLGSRRHRNETRGTARIRRRTP